MTLKELQCGNRPHGQGAADTGVMTKASGTVLVEDEPSIADVLTIALRYHGFDVWRRARYGRRRRRYGAGAPTWRCST